MLRRILRHLLATGRSVRRAFPQASLRAIEEAVRSGELLHDGELRVVIETELGWRELLAGVTPRQRAVDLFASLRVWDTERNNGVLIYVLHADRDVEIVADRGFNGRVGETQWREACDLVRGHFARGEFEAGAVAGVAAVSRLMAAQFPAGAAKGRNEMPDRPVMF